MLMAKVFRYVCFFSRL